MSDVRGRLVAVISLNEYGNLDGIAVADAILERFDVTLKPAIYAKQLGMLVADSHAHGEPDFEEQGNRALRALARAGLKIVRVDE
jgi:hypothetical protein